MLAHALERVNAEIERQPEPTEPLCRSWRQVAECPSDASRIRVVQWNMLAQALSGGNTLQGLRFTRMQAAHVSWERRRWYVLREILRHRPDVVSLNEVDNFQFVSEQLQLAGYGGFFKAKPRSPCLHFADNSGPDGTALFYNKERLHCLQSDGLVLMEEELEEELRGAQVAVLLRLRHSASGRELLVAGTHLKAKVEHGRLRQLQTLALERLLAEAAPADAPLLLCGDFNGESFEEFYATLSGSRLGLSSAYAEGLGAEPPYTSVKFVGNDQEEKRVARAIDYIWYRRLRLCSLMEVPPVGDVGDAGLPNAAFPSDHLCIGADFCLS